MTFISVKFYEKLRAHERENRIARYHLISMVCTLVNYMQLSTNQRARNRTVVVKYIFIPDREQRSEYGTPEKVRYMDERCRNLKEHDCF